MKGMKWFLLLAVGVGMGLGAVGCGGDDDDNGGGGSGVTGHWKGTSAMNGKTHPEWASLSQSGTQVTGMLEDQYPLAGTLYGNALALTVAPHTNSGVSFTGSIKATVTGNSMAGTMTVVGRENGLAVAMTGIIDMTKTGKALAEEEEVGLIQSMLAAAMK